MNRDKSLEGKIEFVTGSGNVFADLGLPDPDERLIKAQLIYKINQIVTERKLTQARAADILGIEELDFSNLILGKAFHYSLEKLFCFLSALGLEVEIKLTDKQSNITE